MKLLAIFISLIVSASAYAGDVPLLGSSINALKNEYSKCLKYDGGDNKNKGYRFISNEQCIKAIQGMFPFPFYLSLFYDRFS